MESDLDKIIKEVQSRTKEQLAKMKKESEERYEQWMRSERFG